MTITPDQLREAKRILSRLDSLRKKTKVTGDVLLDTSISSSISSLKEWIRGVEDGREVCTQKYHRLGELPNMCPVCRRVAYG